jgi:hypothetical protein
MRHGLNPASLIALRRMALRNDPETDRMFWLSFAELFFPITREPETAGFPAQRRSRRTEIRVLLLITGIGIIGAAILTDIAALAPAMPAAPVRIELASPPAPSIAEVRFRGSLQ